MKIKTINIEISRDPMSKLPKTVWPWEVPLFNEQWPGGLVAVIGESVVERDKLPDPEFEFGRLRRTFGAEEETKISLVDLVYGRGPEGVKGLAKAMKAAVVKAKARPRKKAAAKKAPSKAD